MQSQTIATVTSAASSYDLTTLDVIKDELGITDNASNAKLQRYLTSASSAIAQFCNRVFPAETLQEQFWATRDRWPRLIRGGIPNIQLSRWPVVSVTSVTENGVAMVEATDFKTDKVNGQLIRIDADGFPRPWPAFPIVVVYVGGYSTIPADVVDAAIRMVRQRWLSKDRDPLVKQRSIPGVLEEAFWVATGNEAGNLPPDVADILTNYRVPVFAM
jgi:hypothetical protein